MKDKEPNNLFFPADESPVPLPSVEDAWSDMRKKLDEEMPDRALFFIWRRAGLLSILLLLSIGVFWFIERRGAGEKTGAARKTENADAKQSTHERRAEDPATEKLKAITGEVQVEKTTEGRQIENAPGKRPEASINGEKQERILVKEKTIKSAERGQKENAPAVGMKRNEAHRREADKQDQRTVVADLPRPGRDSILVWVNMPKSAGVGARRPARKENKNADQPRKTKKLVADDSTRILWAAGLQDSKSFPVGAQQPVDYNASLKKDLWFDYVPAPYFQYFISKRIGFQVALQFNNPQYTEAVSIFKKKGTVTGSFSNDTDIVVRKLYYLSIPLTVYYSPFRHLYLGAGLQFSNLSNGVAFQNNVVHYVGAGSGQSDTVLQSKPISLKEYRPAYSNLKRTDWRALLEMNYYWKRISLGVQLQQGLSDYLYTPVDGSTGKDKNSSFNVYLRYNLWERRIRIAPARN